jgi:hypothetical protein
VANPQQEYSMKHQEGLTLSRQHHSQQRPKTHRLGLLGGACHEAAYQFGGAHTGQQQQADLARHQQPPQHQPQLQQQAQQGRQQQGTLGAPGVQQQQQQRRTFAASLWSGGVNLSGLSRMPAAGTAAQPKAAVGSTPAATGSAGGHQQGGKAVAAAQKDSCLAAAVAAAAGLTQAGPVQPRKGGKAAGRGSKSGNSKRGAHGSSSSSGVFMAFVPSAPGDATQQPKLHQTTLKDTLKRAERNKQRNQQQECGSNEQQGGLQNEYVAGVNEQGGGTEHGGSAAAKQLAPRKRKRSTSAAAAAAGAGSCGASAGASGGGRSGGCSGTARGKKAPKLSKTVAALEAAVEALDTWSLGSGTAAMQQKEHSSAILLDATLPGTAMWQQLQRELASAEGVALGLLYSRTVSTSQPAGSGVGAPLAIQYFSSLQPPYKQQSALLIKAASYAKKQAGNSAAAAAAAAADAVAGAEAGGDAAQDPADTAGVQQIVGLAVMPVPRGSASSAAAAGGRPAAGASYFIKLQQQQKVLPAHVQQLLQAVLCDTGKRPCVCCSAKAVLCSLANQGLPLQAASCASVIDPELLGWLLDPQLIQDTKDEACYTLEQQLSRNGMKVSQQQSFLLASPVCQCLSPAQ